MNACKKLVPLLFLALALLWSLLPAQDASMTSRSNDVSGREAAERVIATEGCDETVDTEISIDPGHPWRPPFGLDRVGKPPTIVVELSAAKRLRREYMLVGYTDGKELERRYVHVQRASSIKVPVTFNSYPTEVVLFTRCKFEGQRFELVRKAISLPSFEAAAIARPEEAFHPVDLGTILVPAGWLLLGPRQQASLDVAAISYAEDIPAGQVAAWYASAPHHKSTAHIELRKRQRVEINLALPVPQRDRRRDVLHVSITDAVGKERWQKKIPTMLVWKPPKLAEFGATETKLRYDAPISVRNTHTGGLSSLDYDNAWEPHLKDVVVSLPNGSRFVFWRGSSYVPFWAGRHNTGLSYEWAETIPPEGFADAVEPLMDRELRYGRVEIVESTAARVHVRWSYQATDVNYRVWGDTVVEDFYFYPDSFGTRVLSIKSAPDADYELSEFIVLTSQGTYPLEVIPRAAVEFLYLDGRKREFLFPPSAEGSAPRSPELGETPNVPIVYRVWFQKHEKASPIYFSPNIDYPKIIFPPNFDRGYLVTPAYWGDHWPLSGGKAGNKGINDGIYRGPAHNSLMSFGRGNRPPTLRVENIQTFDASGQSRPMTVRRWVWLIGMTEASDARLLEWARSFSRPPALELQGARLDFAAYVPERRAVGLVVEDQTVEIIMRPLVKCVNPVFELRGVPGNLLRVTLQGRPVPDKEYAWDGRTFWLKADIEQKGHIRLDFADASN